MPIKTPLEQVQELIDYVGEEENNWLLMRDGCKNTDDYNHDQKMFGTYFKIRVILERHKDSLSKGIQIPFG